jgi:hypothetical protein
LKNRTRKGSPADNQHLFVVLFQLFDQRHEVAVTSDDDEGVDVISGERHLKGVKGEIDIGAVFVSAGREVALHHLDRMLRHTSAVLGGPLPVTIGDFRYNFAAFFDCFQNCSDIKVAIQGALDTDLDVIEIDKNGNF